MAWPPAARSVALITWPTVTATQADGTPVGFTIGSFTSVSLDPPLVGFLPMTDSERWKAIEATGPKGNITKGDALAGKILDSQIAFMKELGLLA